MRRDDYKFIFTLAATLLLMAAVVFSSYRQELALSPAPTVDLPRLERLIEQGVVSDHEASWWESAPAERP
jgi:hypothetical protein